VPASKNIATLNFSNSVDKPSDLAYKGKPQFDNRGKLKSALSFFPWNTTIKKGRG